MSTSANDSQPSSRYSDQQPRRGDPEWAEWQRLSAEDHQSALEALDAEQAFERYEGPLDWSAFVEERNRDSALRELGIGPVELPDSHRQALGPQRVGSVERLVEEELIAQAHRPRSIDELVRQAQELPGTAASLNLELAERIARLEERRE